jgi:acyl-coenzyme A synthetase/AMP-(fatty) acid ligase
MDVKMHRSAVQTKPTWVQNQGNGSIDLPRALSQPFSNTPEILSFEIPEDLKSYIKNSEFSLYEIVTASMAILLHRFSAQDHLSLCVLFGSDKPHVVALNFSEETLSTDIMTSFKQAKLNAQACEALSQDVALLIEQSSIYRSANEEGSFPHYNMQAKLIDFLVIKIDRKLYIEVAYNRRHIREWLINKMMEALFTMFEDICTEKALPVRRLRLLSPTRLLSLRPRRAHDADLYYFSVIKMFELMVKESPFSTAVECINGQKISYEALSSVINRFANYLITVRTHHVPIAIIGSGTPLSLIATLACMKVSIPYVSVPANLPLASLQSVMTQHKIVLCISNQPIESLAVTWIDRYDSQEMNACSPNCASVLTEANEIVGYYYTAGRGGVSRAVPITHKLIFNQVASMQQLDIWSKDDRVYCYDETGYIVSLNEFIVPLLNGATLVIASDQARQSAKALRAELNAKKITICYLKPGYIRGLIREGFFKADYSLRKIFCYGGPLCENDLCHMNKPDLVLNSYLLTEVAGFVSYAHCNFRPSTVDFPVSLDDSRFEIIVLDEERRLLPIGALGQIFLTVQKQDIAHLLNDSSLESSFFEMELFGKKRLYYKTDDYGRWIAGKNLILSHHRKQPIFAFDCHANLNELAHKVVNVGAVKRACVIAFPVEKNAPYLVVFIVSAQKKVTERFMRDTFASLKFCIPNSILPKMLVAVDEFDYTSQGDVDRNKMLEKLKSNNYISRLSFGVQPMSAALG